MMILKKFSVSNYKCFKNKVTIDFGDVGDYKFNSECLKNGVVKTGLVYGKNGSGKSTLGFALFDIVLRLTNNKFLEEQIQFTLNADSSVKSSLFEYVFQDGEREIVYSYRINDRCELTAESMSVDDSEWFTWDFSKPSIDNLLLRQIPETQDLHWELRNPLMSIVRFVNYNGSASVNHPMRKICEFADRMLWFRNIDIANRFAGFMDHSEGLDNFFEQDGLLDELNAFLLEQDVHEEVVLAKVPTGNKVMFFKHKRLLPFMSVASSGTKALVLFFYWYKQLEKASFVFADEFDAFYHFDVAENIIKMAKCLDKQILFTSHNTDLITNGLLRPDCYFVLSSKKIVPLMRATKRVLREGHNLANLYKNGEFDG